MEAQGLMWPRAHGRDKKRGRRQSDGPEEKECGGRTQNEEGPCTKRVGAQVQEAIPVQTEGPDACMSRKYFLM